MIIILCCLGLSVITAILYNICMNSFTSIFRQFHSRFEITLDILVSMFIHTLCISMYAVVYYYLIQYMPELGNIHWNHDNEKTFLDYFYMSIVCYTSLGFGEIYANGQLRLLTGFETLNGLILIGWTVAHTFCEAEKSRD